MCFSLKDAFHSRSLYFLTMMMFCSVSSGYFLSSNFKTYGLDKISDDSFLTLVGSLSSLFNGGGRLFWGIVFDKIDFKKTYSIILIIQILVLATMRFISDYKASYLIWVCIGLLCEGGHFVIFPPISLRVFGPNVGSKIYCFLLIVCGISNMKQFGINLGVRHLIGYDNEFYIFLGFTLVSLIICIITNIRFKN